MAVQSELRDLDEERPWLPYPGRFTLSVAALTVPLAAIMGGFAANSDVSPATAFIAWGAMSVVGGLIVRRHLQREWDAVAMSEATREIAPVLAGGTMNLPLHAILDSLDLPVLMLDGDRRISFFNRAAEDVLGAVIPGKDVATAIRNPEMLAAVDKVLATGQGTSVEFRRRQPVNRMLHARIEALPSDGASASESNYIVMLDDLTDSERMREVRSDFVADVSHELRTPLAAVLSIVETLNGAARDDPEAQARFMTLLDEQASRMARIVDDLLSLSRIEMNEHRPPEGVAELGEVIGSIVESARMMASERNVTIDVQQAEPVHVVGEVVELSRVFQNLIENAVKYGSENSTVRVKVQTEDGRAIVSVADQGVGIEREHIPRLTERFYRVDKGRSRAAGGTGLGLAIVKHVVSRHRGRLRIDSEVGQGSTFTVELPLAPG